ncbi:hypothetical protein [Bacillus sp. DHT2]|nr:hypothetical protein [Bacillus sp. DHT2]
MKGMKHMKINIMLPEARPKYREQLRFLIYLNTFGGTNLSELCEVTGVPKQNLYRSFKGISKDKTTEEVLAKLFSFLPYPVDQQLIDEANRILDGANALLMMVGEKLD